MNFDNLMEMEGWDHFFLYERDFALYPEMKAWLRTIGDAESLRILEDFESHLKSRGVPLSPKEIERFLNQQDNLYLQSCPDWEKQYIELRKQRWERVLGYLEKQGLSLGK
jgi:hypothetical protein